MKRVIFLLSLILSGAALGAAGDAIYRVRSDKEITQQQVVCYATCAKNHGAWSGDVSDIRSLNVNNLPDHKILVSVVGVRRAPLSSIIGTDEVLASPFGGIVVEGVEK